MSKFPTNLKYTKEHEWVEILSPQKVRVGITDHAQGSLGDIVYLELPKLDRILKPAETFGVVESIKAVSDLYSPLSGKVTAINEALTQDTGSINTQPYASWMIEVEISQPSELDSLLNSTDYESLVKSL
jgi:glycine cleavage system H protein